MIADAVCRSAPFGTASEALPRGPMFLDGTTTHVDSSDLTVYIGIHRCSMVFGDIDVIWCPNLCGMLGLGVDAYTSCISCTSMYLKTVHHTLPDENCLGGMSRHEWLFVLLLPYPSKLFGQLRVSKDYGKMYRKVDWVWPWQDLTGWFWMSGQRKSRKSQGVKH